MTTGPVQTVARLEPELRRSADRRAKYLGHTTSSFIRALLLPGRRRTEQLNQGEREENVDEERGGARVGRGSGFEGGHRAPEEGDQGGADRRRGPQTGSGTTCAADSVTPTHCAGKSAAQSRPSPT